MQLTPFIADSVADAVQQIRQRLGPEAVVASVRPLSPQGLSRLWQKPRIEVFAYLPEAQTQPPSAETLPFSVVAELKQELAALRQQVRGEAAPETGTARPAASAPVPDPWSNEKSPVSSESLPEAAPETVVLQARRCQTGGWRIGSVLQRTGMLPLHAERIVEELAHEHGQHPPESLNEEFDLARRALARLWRKPQPFLEDSWRPHVLIGPFGSGKTTALSKWLTQLMFVEGRTPRVWRLDGATANTAEPLSVYCDVLRLPIERTWQRPQMERSSDPSFIDLPGVDWRNPAAVSQLGTQLKDYCAPHLHLVLNAAYETSLLLEQIKAFSALPVEDLILTHLDEEPRWGKIWNLVLGTNYSVRFLSAGQNVPGEFSLASAEKTFSRQFPA